jgi:hypothetical protein
MQLFIANGTQQTQRVTYRLPERKGGPQFVDIEMGAQEVVPGATSRYDIDAVIEQQGHYGMISVEHFENMREKAIAPLIYSVDKPVPFESIMRLVDYNNGRLAFRGMKMREEAALATSAAMRNPHGMIRTPNAADNLRVSVQQENSVNGEKQIAEGVRIDPELARA